MYLTNTYQISQSQISLYNIQMNEPTFSLMNKSKLVKAESSHSSNSHVERFERSKSNSKPNQTVYLMVYLSLEKNVRVLVQSCKKIVFKTNRAAFRQLLEFSKNDKCERNVSNYFTSTQKLKTQTGKAKVSHQQQNPEKRPKQIENLCFKKTAQMLSNVVNIAEKVARNTLCMSWIRLQCFGMQTSVEDFHNQVPFESQSITKNVSRLSNKRKVTKGREQYKENSHMSLSEIAAQNRRLKNELVIEQYEREAFVEQLGELLEKHEKSLAQGYSTTRTHKKNK